MKPKHNTIDIAYDDYMGRTSF